MKQGDLVSAQESDSTLENEGVYRKMVHERWTGPSIAAVITRCLCYYVFLSGQRIRERRAPASHAKSYHIRLVELRHEFDDEYAYFAWESDLGLASPSTVASPLYNLED